MTAPSIIPPPAPLGANWGWTLNGSAVTAGTDLQLSAAGNRHTAGSALFAIPQAADGLMVSFTTIMNGGSGGGGIALLLADPTQTGPAIVGSSVGFGFTGIPGVAVIISTQQDNTVGSSNFVGIAASGVAAPAVPVYTATTTSVPALRTGSHAWTATVTGSLLAVTCDGTEVLTATVSLGASVLIGFSGSTTNTDDNHLVRAVTVSTAAPTALAPYQFAPETYGAAGDNATDDTAAINRAVTAAVAYAQANNGYCEIVFQPRTYLLSAAPTTGGATQGSAQIPLPVIAETAEKVTLVFRGTADQSGLYHWHQTTPQRAGAVLRSTYSAGDSLPATGEVSVIGGPTPHFKGDPPSTWNNMLVVIDGISIEIPPTVDICGMDFRCTAEANIPNAGVLVLSTQTGAPPIPQPNWAFGVAMPVANNNDNANIGYLSVEGMVIGLEIFEHVQATSIRLINCYDGLVVASSSGFPHSNVIVYASIENCTNSIVMIGGLNKLDIIDCDLEWGTGRIINDTLNNALGTVNLGSNGASGASLNTALSTGATAAVGTSLRIVNRDQSTGHVAPPALPATTVALQNPFWRDAAVTVSGGTVTAITVDGAATGITAGTVFVPTGKSVAITYSAAPSWSWVLI